MEFSEFIGSIGNSLQMPMGEHLFRQGDQDEHLYMVRQGLLKAYYLADDGKETIKSFIAEGDMIGSLTATQTGEGCTFSLQCLEDCHLIKLPFGALEDAANSNLDIARPVIRFLIAFAMKKERREYEFLHLSPEARFRKFLERSPQLLDRISQKDIALYLGLTPVGLSRIKKRVLND